MERKEIVEFNLREHRPWFAETNKDRGITFF